MTNTVRFHASSTISPDEPQAKSGAQGLAAEHAGFWTPLCGSGKTKKPEVMS